MHFTSFHVKGQLPLGHFRGLSAHSQVISMEVQEPSLKSLGVSHHIPITSHLKKSAEDILAYPRGFAFAAADVSGLRRIRVSVDDEKRTGVHRRLISKNVGYGFSPPTRHLRTRSSRSRKGYALGTPQDFPSPELTHLSYAGRHCEILGKKASSVPARDAVKLVRNTMEARGK
ncbi:hypothetical protein F5B19DRAFT_502648 [Rostrohypoxylon terebratum]|nr:hypothetical protein F5B19DRAFT_502648 [Rostrohypoxylon terebratum]